MIATLGLIFGFLSSILPLGAQLLQFRLDVQRQIQLRTLELEFVKQNLTSQIELANILATLREGESLRTHDSTINPTGFVNVVRALIRPGITIILFGFWLAVKVALLHHLIVNEDLPFLSAAPVILDDFTQSLLGAVMGFWFGQRAIERRSGGRL